MRNRILNLLLALTLLTSLRQAVAQGTAFTYQGQLNRSDGPANGYYDFTFGLFNNNGTNSGQVGGTLTTLDVGVTNGLFIVAPDFGAVFTAADFWLQIDVRTNGAASYTSLSPRQQLTPAPFSILAENVSGAIALAQLPSGLVTNNESGVTLDNVTVGGNLTLPLPATARAFA